eukprot:CAMPEP_0179460716 /NCGR_PEP_ID=MMETSP0799-20121207/43668_1 /TAXON_ID=46947 /ORGANISM="Geminigera cryophila, Strain CCMP2564" /LENGTH=162 /DNA_ID=CAMNT_0021263049 /DNA_START=157 /DNA_END=642 /DNA_ORIENTATION=+
MDEVWCQLEPLASSFLARSALAAAHRPPELSNTRALLLCGLSEVDAMGVVAALMVVVAVASGGVAVAAGAVAVAAGVVAVVAGECVTNSDAPFAPLALVCATGAVVAGVVVAGVVVAGVVVAGAVVAAVAGASLAVAGGSHEIFAHASGVAFLVALAMDLRA